MNRSRGQNKRKALIIEDSFALAEVIQKRLQLMKFGVSVALDGEVGLERASTNTFSIIICDISIPIINGLELIKIIKTQGVTTPILVITNHVSKPKTLESFKSGANLFHPKPIDFDLLVEQVKMLTSAEENRQPIVVGDLTIDPKKITVKKNSKYVHLRRKEFELLFLLVKHPGRVYSRGDIIRLTNINFSRVDESSVDTLVHRLRKKLGTYKKESPVETVHRKGYRLHRNYYEELEDKFNERNKNYYDF